MCISPKPDAWPPRVCVCVCVVFLIHLFYHQNVFQSTSPFAAARNKTPEEVANIKKLAMALAPISLSLPPWYFVGGGGGSNPLVPYTPEDERIEPEVMMVWFRWFSGFQLGWIFRFHVNLPGCNMLVKMCFFPKSLNNGEQTIFETTTTVLVLVCLFVWGCGARGN